MSMYATIATATASPENRANYTDPTICKMIVAGFTGQLRGWWDNFLDDDKREAIFNATNDKPGKDNLGRPLRAGRSDAVYTLMLTIIEHFGGRFTNQYENIRTLFNGLKCKHLGEFRWYKDTFLSRVMDLLESKYDHWKAKFIDGLPPLFAERVRKSLRGSYGEVQYSEKTYGQLIVACTQEGLALCNELKLARQIKLDKLREKSQLGDFCEQFDDFELPNSDSELDQVNKCNDCDNDVCNCDEMMYKLQVQFKDLDLNVQTLTTENVLELLKEVTDEKLREKILNFATQKTSANTSISKDNFFDNHHMSYSLPEVNRRLALSKTPSRDTIFNDLKIEVEQLKREIVSLKQNQMISDHKISKIEEKIIEIPETSFTSKDKDLEYSENGEIDKLSPTEDLKRDYFLGMMQIVTAHK
ncbi:hypothetical protein FXO38_27233 [Capsicum annuum]|nr:hypothetical protein FXO38_27233 [Capsicum annuum]